jgi:hypothetical protein
MRLLVFVALAASLFLLPFARSTSVEAGTAVRLDIEDLVQRCDLSFEGRVVAKTAMLDARGRVETEYVVSVARSFVGAPMTRRTFRLPGGTLPDGRGMLIAGMPSIAEREDVLVFLTRENELGARMPVGLAQGKLAVAVEKDGRKVLKRDTTALELVPAPGAKPRPVDGGAVLDYAATIARIQSAASARGARPR